MMLHTDTKKYFKGFQSHLVDDFHGKNFKGHNSVKNVVEVTVFVLHT